jgi:hypothetical protein
MLILWHEWPAGSLPGKARDHRLAVARNGSSPALDFLERLDLRELAQVVKLFQWLGDLGWINNREKFKPIEGTDFFEFKAHQVRMPCYRSGNLFIVTHGFRKKKDAIDPQEIARAVRIRKEDELPVGDREAVAARAPKGGTR